MAIEDSHKKIIVFGINKMSNTTLYWFNAMRPFLIFELSWVAANLFYINLVSKCTI